PTPTPFSQCHLYLALVCMCSPSLPSSANPPLPNTLNTTSTRVFSLCHFNSFGTALHRKKYYNSVISSKKSKGVINSSRVSCMSSPPLLRPDIVGTRGSMVIFWSYFTTTAMHDNDYTPPPRPM
ncbi:unnamed protein product, partial [Laminaria digitata]